MKICQSQAHPLVKEFERRRKLAGVLQKDVIKRAKVSRATLGRWLYKEGALPNLYVLQRLNQALDAILAERFED